MLALLADGRPLRVTWASAAAAPPAPPRPPPDAFAALPLPRAVARVHGPSGQRLAAQLLRELTLHSAEHGADWHLAYDGGAVLQLYGGPGPPPLEAWLCAALDAAHGLSEVPARDFATLAFMADRPLPGACPQAVAGAGAPALRLVPQAASACAGALPLGIDGPPPGRALAINAVARRMRAWGRRLPPPPPALGAAAVAAVRADFGAVVGPVLDDLGAALDAFNAAHRADVALRYDAGTRTLHSGASLPVGAGELAAALDFVGRRRPAGAPHLRPVPGTPWPAFRLEAA